MSPIDQILQLLGGLMTLCLPSFKIEHTLTHTHYFISGNFPYFTISKMPLKIHITHQEHTPEHTLE